MIRRFWLYVIPGGILQITIQIGPHRKVYYETHDDLRNKWTDFKIQADFSRTKGYAKAWINDKQVLDYAGVTAYGQERGYPPNSYFYFKMGLTVILCPSQ